jgi:HAD superfamily hydrolase (TIGR01509 family)
VAIALVVFDCDGVLFRSEQANVAFYNEVLRRTGEPPLDDWGEAACHALSSAQLFEKYYGDRPDVLSRLRAAAHELDYGPFYPLMEPREGVYDVLPRLRGRYKIAMATNRGKTVHGVLEHFGLAPLFDFAVGVLDVARPKPHPDMLLRCVERFDVRADLAVYVGDQPTDAASAHAAGMQFIALGRTVPDATYRIAELTELEAVLATL